MISGSGTLTNMGSGTLVLSGENTYTGTTTIQNGTIALAGGDDRLPTTTALSLSSGDVTDNGFLTFNRSDELTVANRISGAGALTQAGDGTLVLTGEDSYTGTPKRARFRGQCITMVLTWEVLPQMPKTRQWRTVLARIICVGTRSRKSLVGLRKPRLGWFARRALEARPTEPPKSHQGLGLLVTTLLRHE